MLMEVQKLRRFFASHPLTRDRQLAAWYRFSRWQIASRLGTELIVPWIAGLKLAARQRMHGATGNIYTGLHEFPDMMMACHLLRKDDLFVDVGANIGSYSILASGLAAANVIAFEPDPETAALFRRNIEVNSLQSLVELHESAAGDCEKVIQFTVGQDTVNRVAEHDRAQTRGVLQTTLDNVLADKHPLMMKADVEGYEENVIRGAEQTLRNPSLKVVLLETVTPWTAKALSSHGFHIRHYDPFSRTLSETPVYTSSNTLFIRDEKVIQQRLETATPLAVFGRAI